MIKSLLFFFSVSYVVGQQDHPINVGSWSLYAIHKTCSEVPLSDLALGRSSCASACEADSNCTVFVHENGNCKLFSSCTPIPSSTIYAEIFKQLVQKFSDSFYLDTEEFHCDSGPRLSLGNGAEGLGSLEDCAKECLTTYGQNCVSISWKKEIHGTLGENRCSYHHDGCRPVYPFWNKVSDTRRDLYVLSGVKWWPEQFDSNVQSSIEAGKVVRGDVGSGSELCESASVWFDSDTNTQAYAIAKCSSQIYPWITETDYVYPVTAENDGIKQYKNVSVCAKLCYDWNRDPANTLECRGFSVKRFGNPNFSCRLLACNPYTTKDAPGAMQLGEPSSSNDLYDTWGYLDDFNTPECRGQFMDANDALLGNHYDRMEGQQCDVATGLIYSLQTSSVGECKHRCLGYYGDSCVAFQVNNVGWCEVFSTCSVIPASTSRRFYKRVVYLAETIHDTGTELLVDFDTNCADTPLQTLTDIEYFAESCLTACNDYVGCSSFSLNPVTKACVLFSVCTNKQVDTNFDHFAYPSNPAPSNPECIVSANCSATQVCNSLQECQTQECSSHDDCYDLNDNLGMCNFKKGVCKDKGAKVCSSQRQCKSRAKQRYAQGDQRMGLVKRSIDSTKFGTATLKNQYALRMVQEFNNSYTFVQASEVYIITSSTPEILNAFIDARCGLEFELCEVSSGNRRLLQDENVTITLTFTVDADTYESLQSTGESEISDIEASIAQQLGYNNVTLEFVDGQLEVQFVVVDETLDGEPIDSDAFSTELKNIESSLNGVENTLNTEFNVTNVTLSETDYCGERTCNNQGTCSSSTGVCQCNVDFTGINCEIALNCVTNPCVNNGTCSAVTERCSCDYPYYGPQCDETKICC